MVDHPFARCVALHLAGRLVADNVQARQPPGKPEAARSARTASREHLVPAGLRCLRR